MWIVFFKAFLKVIFLIIQSTVHFCFFPLFLFWIFCDKGETPPQSNIKEASTASSSQPQEDPSDGERLTAELRGIVSQFTQKVCMKTCPDSGELPMTQRIYDPLLFRWKNSK